MHFMIESYSISATGLFLGHQTAESHYAKMVRNKARGKED